MNALRQPSSEPTCFWCGSPDVSEKSGYGSPLCAEHLPIGAHVIHHYTGFVVCDCGWESSAGGVGSTKLLDDRAKAHWREVLATQKRIEAKQRGEVA